MASPLPPEPRRLIELGWLLVHELDPVEFEAVSQARARMVERLRERFGQFDWRMPVVSRPVPVASAHEEPVLLLEEGIYERDNHAWDFTFVVTRSDLRSYYKPYALAVPSRAVAVAVLSTARLAPQQAESLPTEERLPLIAKRLYALGMHLLGDLNGVLHSEMPEDFMYTPQALEDLDLMADYCEDEHEQLAAALREVADIRLEEQPQAQQSQPLAFYVKASWIGASDIASAVIQAKPWEFPLRLSRLSTAALSTLLILLMTAEVWDLGMSQPPLRVALLSAVALLGTSLYILKKQRLLLRRGRTRLTEQTVITNVSISIVVGLGMSTTYLMLFTLALLLSTSLYSEALIHSWAASLEARIGLRHYLVLGGFVASLGIFIGALGASFEGQHYFRHITYADEET